MKLLILGATGGTGQKLVWQALEINHEVTALARDPEKLKIKHDRLTVIKGSVLDRDLVTKAMDGKDAVLSALGTGKSLKPGGLIAHAAENIIGAMKENNIKRLIFLSAFGVGETYAQANFFQKFLYRLFLKNIYADKAKGDELIRQSLLDWTLVYPVVLTDKPFTGKYKSGEQLPMKGVPSISRADTADFILRQLADNTFLKKSPVIMS
jgi:putative NADH-flavin reductase